MTDMGSDDVAVVVSREEDDAWEAEVLPQSLTGDLAGLIQALRQQPSIGGTFGLVAVGDDFFVALRVVGGQVSVFLSDLTAALDWPLARQVMEYLEIDLPGDDDDLDQVLPAGDLSIFADLGIDEMDLGMLAGDLDLFPDEALAIIARKLGFGHALEVPVGAVILGPAGDVLSRAHNQRESDADPTAHAEILAIRAAARALGSWRLEGCTLVVTLEPCPMCAGAVVAARIGRVVYGAADPKAGAAGSLWDIPRDRRLNHRAQVIGGVLAEESAALLREFFARRR